MNYHHEILAYCFENSLSGFEIWSKFCHFQLIENNPVLNQVLNTWVKVKVLP